MKTKTFFVLLVAGLFVFPFSGNVYGESSESSGIAQLVGLLTDQLDVTEKQAKAGSGSLFKMAKDTLSEEDFGKIAEGLPGIDELIQSAPEAPEPKGVKGGLSEKIGGVTKELGQMKETAENVDRLAKVKDQFDKLGMEGDMVSKFIPVLLDYVEKEGGESVMNLLKEAWL